MDSENKKPKQDMGGYVWDYAHYEQGTTTYVPPIFLSPVAPTHPKEGDIWIDTSRNDGAGIHTGPVPDDFVCDHCVDDGAKGYVMIVDYDGDPLWVSCQDCFMALVRWALERP